MSKFSRKHKSIYVEFKDSYDKAVAEFSQSSLLSAIPNAVKVGAGVGAGLGLLQGSGILESDAEKKATNVGNRLGKVLTSTTVGAGLGAGAGYATNRYNTLAAPAKELQRREAVVAEHEAANPRGIRKAAKRVGREVEAVKNKVQGVVAPNLDQREARMSEELKRQSVQPEPTPLIDQAINKGKKDIETTKEFFGGLLGKIRMKKDAGGGIPPNTVNTTATTELSKTMRKSANFQDPATIQRLIQKGSTYIPQDNTGVVSLESAIKLKGQKKKKLNEPKIPASMNVKEINSMIESGKPTGKYFSKGIRKSASFLKSQQQAEFGIGDQINSALTSAGKLITQPAAKAVRKAAVQVGGGDGVSILGNRIAAKIPFVNQMNHGAAKVAAGGYKALTGAANVLDTDKAARLAAIGVGGTALAGGGLLTAKLAQKKQEDEARYSKTIRKSANFMLATGLVNGAQKVARGAANRFGNLSPQINAANVGTAVGAGLGALEGSGINETEEQRRSTGLVGRAGKVLGMTGLGAGVGRGVGSVAGAGVNRYQANQRLQSRRKDNPDSFKNPNTVPRSIEIE
jgi:hypothetical protein